MMLTAEPSSAPASCEGNKVPGLITNGMATAASFSCQQLDSLALSVHSWEFQSKARSGRLEMHKVSGRAE
ncbi:hypothetical protein KOW79_001903 [Hemibagrus wyckioides]|uniref:Uncharacterized protein n=1 Tax=Hemibagrus wyckioides TaxID=337641 RepID=A0A9D3P688_9TELE|nr:hypothetical protein KOW79_001903 [Hemibagrus wyckioides]